MTQIPKGTIVLQMNDNEGRQKSYFAALSKVRLQDWIPTPLLPPAEVVISILTRIFTEQSNGPTPTQTQDTQLDATDVRFRASPEPDPAIQGIVFRTWELVRPKSGSDYLASRLAQLASAKHRRAEGQPGVFQFASKILRRLYDDSDPDSPNGQIIAMSSANATTITMLSPTPSPTEVAVNADVPPMLTCKHKAGCSCPLLTVHNNVPALAMGLVCKPLEFNRRYIEDTTKHSEPHMAPNCPKKVWSPHHIFKGTVNQAGLTLQTLQRRQTPASMTRTQFRRYQPQFADINLDTDTSLATSVFMQVMRPEFAQLTYRFANPKDLQGVNPHIHRQRYRSISDHPADSEIHTFPNIGSVEDVLLDAPTKEIFSHPTICPWCCVVLRETELTELASHIQQQHSDVMTSRFSCPSCLWPPILTAETFGCHWMSHHQPLLSLMAVASESHIGERLQMGLAFKVALAFSGSRTYARREVIDGDESWVTPYAVYGSRKPEILLQELFERRVEHLPQTFRSRANQALMQEGKVTDLYDLDTETTTYSPGRLLNYIDSEVPIYAPRRGATTYQPSPTQAPLDLTHSYEPQPSYQEYMAWDQSWMSSFNAAVNPITLSGPGLESYYMPQQPLAPPAKKKRVYKPRAPAAKKPAKPRTPAEKKPAKPRAPPKPRKKKG